MGSSSCPETSESSCQSTTRNIPDDRGPHTLYRYSDATQNKTGLAPLQLRKIKFTPEESAKTSALDGGGWSTPRPGRFTPPGNSRYPLYTRLGRPQGRSGWVREMSPPPAVDPRNVQSVPSRYTDCAIQVDSYPNGNIALSGEPMTSSRQTSTAISVYLP